MDLINEKRTFNTLRLTDNQKKVMTRIISSATEKLAAQEISKGRALITARDILVKLQMIDFRDGYAALTSDGEKLMKDYNLVDETGQLTDDGNEFAYDKEEQPVTESLIKQINILAEGKVKQLDMDVKELIHYARKDKEFILAKKEGNEKTMKRILADLMGKVGDDPSDDHLVVAYAMGRLLNTGSAKYMD